MGSFFHVNIVDNVTCADLENMKNDGYTLVAGALNGDTKDYRENVYGKKTVVVVGNEANGVSDEILKICYDCVKIQIYGKAESLNVAVAASLILYKTKEFEDVQK